ncbi:MAG: TonB-dependent receptor [Hyphococcus sp.]|nr:MAG: TonB-dependent receptor [Marinicaulis sp.]
MHNAPITGAHREPTMKMQNAVKVSAIALAAAIATPQLSYAQDSAVDALRDVIVVTGTKKKDAENVQDVPLAVTAYGDKQLDALKVRDLQSLTVSIPNVSFDDIGTTKGTANFSIRGVGINSSIPSIDPTVGVFKDGVYLGINGGVVFDIFDLESIEVLRGPQGILFGRNVTGGAVLINGKRPTGEYEASAKIAAESGLRGTEGNYYVMGAVGGPLAEDLLSARVSVYYNKDNGYHERYLGGPVPNALAEPFYTTALDPLLGAGTGVVVGGLVQGPGIDRTVSFGEATTFIVRPSLLFTPTDDFELYVGFEHGESEGDGPPAQNHVAGSGAPNFFYEADRDSFDFSIDNEGRYDNVWNQVTAEFNVDVAFGDGQITNIFGWREYRSETDGDIDATPLFLFHSTTSNDQSQWSNEMRYNGRFMDRLDVTAGFYYFTQDIAYTERRFILGGLQNFFGGGKQQHEVLGVFGQFDYDLTDALTLVLGGRYTHEEKDVQIANIRANGNIAATVFGVPGCGVVEGTCPIDFRDGASWSNFTPKVGLQYAVDDSLNIYAHWTQGVRSGGYNFRNTSTTVFDPGPFDEENVNAFEIGFKAQPESIPLTVNAAVYYNDINDMQREINLADPVTGVVQIIDNTADATIWGFEVETQFAVTDNLLLLASVGHTNGEYDEILADISSNGSPGPAVIDADDFALEIPRLAPWTYSAGFVHSIPIGSSSSLNTRFNYAHRDMSFYTDNNLGFLNEVDIMDASISLSTYEDRVNISLYGKNLLDEVNFGGDTQLPASLGGGTFSPITKGRIVGVEVQLTY